MWVLLVNPKPFSVPLSLIVVPWTLPKLLPLDFSPNNTSRIVYCPAVLLEHKLHEDRNFLLFAEIFPGPRTEPDTQKVLRNYWLNNQRNLL